MSLKEDLLFELERLKRRTSFRSDSRVNSSTFFSFLFKMLEKINTLKEEDLEKSLEKGFLQFRAFDPPYIIDFKYERKKMEEE